MDSGYQARNIKQSQYGQSIGFTGRYFDSETGLYYFRARYYDTEQGRFISRDPAGYVDGMGLYNGYFAMSFAMDPSGRLKEEDFIEGEVPDGFDALVLTFFAVNPTYKILSCKQDKSKKWSCIAIVKKLNDKLKFQYVVRKGVFDRNTPAQNKTLINHEEGHKIIAEKLYKKAILILKKIKGKGRDCDEDKAKRKAKNNIKKNMKKKFKSLEKQIQDIQDRYDKETNHGRYNQRLWDDLINKF